ncbi:hypothetical protein KUTeg_013245 [Tegillarca granosa]|uniref:Synaptosomal-associated protein n=1 Tax=Tegillarca granosa TaxID=220873 RepID=A0ABQ9EVJ9_TEGGR|nr:hypothetical protein KUTeg_013245 [Tegillarca granosa]
MSHETENGKVASETEGQVEDSEANNLKVAIDNATQESLESTRRMLTMCEEMLYMCIICNNDFIVVALIFKYLNLKKKKKCTPNQLFFKFFFKIL